MAKVLAVDTRVFYRHSERSWESGIVIGCEETAKGLKYSVKAAPPFEEIQDGVPQYDVHRQLDGVLDAKPDDLLQLSELHVSVLLSVLRNRFKEDNIYTNIGSLIIAVNPFKWSIPWYKPEKGVEYIDEGWKGAPLNRSGLRPHSWAVANKSYWDMITQGNQSILISGESGAGKTEGAKIILRYLGDLCVRLLEKDNGSEAEKKAVHDVNEKLQTASPILESFGNAKTTRNDNSSRFGKFMKMQFNSKGILVGMDVTPYLLEKSRVVKAGPEERLYHSFYQLVFGATPEQKEKYLLEDAKTYKSLKAGGCLTIPKVNDAEDYQEVLRAMDTVGFSSEEVDACWRVVAACLHLSCVEFTENENAHSKVEDAVPVQKAAAMLQVNAEELQKGLVTKTLRSSRDVNIIPLNKSQASDTRNSLCMFIYEKNFLRLVDKINDVVSKPEQEDRWIGLLDIFGFENFETNSFEQLCINLANERLQKHYNTYVYDKDLQECREEGIKNATEGVVVNDNKPCLDLIMGAKDSILSILDDRCKSTQKGDLKDDQKFLDIMIETFGGEKRDKGTKRNAEGQVIVKRENPADFFEYDPRKPTEFAVHHYAGKVRYDYAGFVNKNIDLLSDQIKQVIRESESELIATLMPSAPKPGERTTRVTVSGTFRRSLTELIDTIQSTKPNWVRCIRPNPQKVSDRFHTASVLDQLTCSGVVETVKTRQQGFCYRMPFEEFSYRYSVCGDKTVVGNRQRCSTILMALKIDKSEGQVGKTKVFLKVKAHQHIEESREDKLKTHVVTMQTLIRWRASRVVVMDRKYSVMGRRVQKWVKFVMARDEMVKEHFRKVLGQLLVQHKKEREEMVKKELTSRQETTKEETSARLGFSADHKEGLRPLWAAVLIRCQGVEEKAREDLFLEEDEEFALFSPAAKEDRSMCKSRQDERKRREKQARKEQRLAIEMRETAVREIITEEEIIDREAIRDEWIPVNRKMQVLIQRIHKLNAAREKKMKQLQLEMEIEIKRKIRDDRKTYKEERYLWQRHSELNASLHTSTSTTSASYQSSELPSEAPSTGAWYEATNEPEEDNDDWLVHEEDRQNHMPTVTPPVPREVPTFTPPFHSQPPMEEQSATLHHQDSSFLSLNQSTALGPIEAIRQEQRFYSAGAPSTIISGDPAMAGISSYAGYSEYWKEAYSSQQGLRRANQTYRQQLKAYKAVRRRCAHVNDTTL